MASGTKTKGIFQIFLSPSEVSPLYAKYSDVNRIRPERIYLPDGFEKSKSLVKPHEGSHKHRLNELGHEDTTIVRIGSSINRISVPEKILNQGVIISDLKESLLKQGDLIKQWRLPMSYNIMKTSSLHLRQLPLDQVFLFISQKTRYLTILFES